MKKIILTLILISANVFGAIVFVPKSVNEVDGLGGAVSIGGALSKGNTETEALSTEFGLVYGDGEDYKHLLFGSYTFGQSSDVKDTNKGIVHYRFTYHIKDNYDVELFAQDEFNEFQNTKMRFLLGSNLRKRVMYFERFFIGTGLFYSAVEPKTITPEDLKREKVKFNLYGIFNHDFNEMVSLSALVFYQPTLYNLDTQDSVDFSDFRLSSRFSLVNKLTEAMNFTTNLTYDYHSSPFVGIKEEDLKLTVGLEYRFK